MDNIRGIENLNNNNSEMEDEFDNCIDDKVCVYETEITGGYIKEEPYDMKDELGNIHNHVDIKDEIIQDPTITIQETGLTTNIKENYLACCDGCGEEYDLYCIKCPMLIRIFNSNNPDMSDNRVMRTLPKNFVDLCETQSGVGIVALRVLPKGVVFGPFEGLDLTKDDAVSKWISVYTNDPKCLNWMQHIRRVDQSSYSNLTPFQYEDGLYYRSDCHISVGEELLVCCDSDREESGTEDGRLKQHICERLDDAYACTFCCVGYKSICHLAEHNSRCPEKRKQNGFCKEIIQCAFCKIYINEEEYSDYHVDQCVQREIKICAEHQEKKQSQRRASDDHPAYQKDVKLFACTHCPYKTTREQQLKEHIVIHNDDKLFGCSLCSYKSKSKANLRKHMGSHNDSKPFGCSLCSHKTKSKAYLSKHMVSHNDGKPFGCSLCSHKSKSKANLRMHMVSHNDKLFGCSLCSHKSNSKVNLKKHMVSHNDDKPFECTQCPHKAKTKSLLKRHIIVHNDDKPFACIQCPFKTRTKFQLQQHIIGIHSDDRPFACRRCSFNTKTHARLKQHMISHNDDKPFACAQCPYKTKRKIQLKAHIAIHNDVKPFGCTQCAYEAKTIGRLRSHIVIHSDDKRFACCLCSHKTRTNFELKRHLTTHRYDV